MLTALGTLILGTVTVTLPAEVQVRGAEMTLGEIAEVTGDDPRLVGEVESFALGYAPSPGYSRVLQSWQIEQRVRKQFDAAGISFEGKAACRVLPTVAVIPAAEIEAEARRSLAALFAGQDVEIELKGELEDQKVPAGLQSRELAAETASIKARSGAGSVPVEIVIDGLPYRTVWTSFEVELFQVMPVMKRDIAPGQTIGAGDVVMQRAAVTSGVGNAPLAAFALIGSTAKHLLPAGRPATERDVRRRLAIERGETVSLVVKNGLVTVTTEVVAIQDAYLGDLVPIRTPGSGKELTARAVGPRRLELHLKNDN